MKDPMDVGLEDPADVVVVGLSLSRRLCPSVDVLSFGIC